MNIAIVNLLVNVISKILSKPKRGTKEIASLSILIPMMITMYDQYQIAGFANIDPAVVSALVGGLFILIQRLYLKYKESEQ